MARPLNLRVAVCVPTFNRAALLERTLKSLLAQTFRDFSLIVADNGSSDATPDVVGRLKDGRLRYARFESSLDMTSSWNRAIGLALDEPASYVALFHDDDFYLPALLEREVDFLERHPRAGLVHAASYYYNEAEGRFSLRRPYASDRTLTALEMLDDLADRGVYHITTPSVLARKDAYLKAGTFDPAFKICPDLDLWWRMLEHYDMGYIAEPLCIVRVHAGQVSSSKAARDNAPAQTEARLVLAGALERFKGRLADPAAYEKKIGRRMARQALLAAKDALLAGDARTVAEACREAPRLSAASDVRFLALALRFLNNAPGRLSARSAALVLRSIRAARMREESGPLWEDLRKSLSA